ncbi:MAG: ABC transporter substrate-binding protein [Chlorobi bacterium]|nr:ABC transporter substrate-binding protein [Chlorobiota bacterium]MCI0715780.1 ABC transporter substrate-binding protein [Chlorobiota bacterium]
MKKLFFGLIAVIAVFSVSCNKSSNEILIGEYESLTGAEATFGISSTNGLNLAVEEINNSGGLLGKKIKLITYDDQGKPQEAATVVQRLIKQDNVVAIIGEVASSRSISGGQICQSNKTPMVTPASTNPEVTAIGDYVYRVCFIDPFQATVMSKFATNTLKLKKVAVLKDVKNAYSTGLADFFVKEFTSMGGQVVVVQSYSSGDKDFKAQLTAIKSENPEGIFIPGYYTDVGLIAIQAREIGITQPLFGGDGWESEKLTEGKAKDALEGSFFSTHVSTDNPDPMVQGFIKKYKEKYGKMPDAMSFLAYDAGMILFEAIKRAGSVEADKIKNELAKTKDFKGVTGTITINEQRNAVKPAVVLEIKNGKFVYKETVQP